MANRKEIESVKDAIKFVREQDAKLVDMKFTDFFGKWQHVTIPANRVDESLFEEGLGFDGSSLRGWQPINASDMQIRPDYSTARVDPFMIEPTVSFVCNIFDPITGQPYSRDPRYIAQKALRYLQSTGIADSVFVGPEAEFFVFDDVRYDLKPHTSFFAIDSIEGAWNTGRDERPNLGYKPDYKGGYFPVPPYDSCANLRNEMALMMERVGIPVEVHHHEVATGGQNEIGMAVDSMLPMADKLQWFRYIVRNVARRHNKAATFMPKPIYGDNGSGMHIHMSLWKDGNPLFAGDKYAGLSQMALYFIGGLLEHGNALIALTNPTTNSYKRLVPGYEAPVKLAYSSRNRSAAIRIPMYASSPKSKRLEFRTPDSTSNCYLGLYRHAHGGHRRHRAPDRSGQPDGQGHLQPAARRTRRHPQRAGESGRSAARARRGPRLLAQRRCLHQRRARDVYRLQVRERDHPHPAAPHAARVRDVLRHLIDSST